MPRANKDQVTIFKREYCRNVESRRKMLEDFEVEVETYEEMLPGKNIRSYATGERNIEDNKKLRILIIFARSMMILHSNEVKPLYGKFKYIYNLLEERPFMHVKSFAVKDVNDAIRNYLLKDVNKNNENFQNLLEYIEYLRNNANGKRVRNEDFESLRVILRNDYPNEVIYF